GASAVNHIRTGRAVIRPRLRGRNPCPPAGIAVLSDRVRDLCCTAYVGFCEGFRMTAACLMRLASGPSSESLQRTNPRWKTVCGAANFELCWRQLPLQLPPGAHSKAAVSRAEIPQRSKPLT